MDNGEPIYTQEYIQSLRDADKKHPDKLKIIAQRGGQERMLSIDADIKIVGGSRGGSKSFSSLMEVLKDIKNPDFHATILRNEKDDLQSLVTDSYKLFSQFGTYNKSQNDMTWNFDNGGWLKFSYYAGAYQDFKTRWKRPPTS